MRALLRGRAGSQCGLLGTVKSVIGGRERPVERTTPEAIDLQADLRAMLDGGDRACAMEVSSHALELGRADAIRFAAAIFTNLTQDHLDFHPTMEDYFQAKRRLFVPRRGSERPAREHRQRRRPLRPAAGRASSTARSRSRSMPPADYSASERALRASSGCSFTPAHARRASVSSRCRCPGASTSPTRSRRSPRRTRSGRRSSAARGALEQGVRVPGRFEPVDEGQDFAVLVDYAHTPDSLENVLRAARELAASAAAAGTAACCACSAPAATATAASAR